MESNERNAENHEFLGFCMDFEYFVLALRAMRECSGGTANIWDDRPQ